MGKRQKKKVKTYRKESIYGDQKAGMDNEMQAQKYENRDVEEILTEGEQGRDMPAVPKDGKEAPGIPDGEGQRPEAADGKRSRTVILQVEKNNEEAEVEAEFDGSLSADGAKKASEFVKFCDAFNIPVLTLTNVTGFSAGEYEEKNLAKETARLTYAFADATVPKVNVVIGKAFGSAYIAMNSKAVGADMVYAWPSAQIGMMEADLAAKIMYAGADAATLKEKAAEYKELQSSPLSAARRGYVDSIIEPDQTRKYVIGAFEMLFTKREDRPVKKHGSV